MGKSTVKLKKTARTLYLTDFLELQWDGDILWVEHVDTRGQDIKKTYPAKNIKKVISIVKRIGYGDIANLLKEGHIYIYGRIEDL